MATTPKRTHKAWRNNVRSDSPERVSAAFGRSIFNRLDRYDGEQAAWAIYNRPGTRSPAKPKFIGRRAFVPLVD